MNIFSNGVLIKTIAVTIIMMMLLSVTVPVFAVSGNTGTETSKIDIFKDIINIIMEIIRTFIGYFFGADLQLNKTSETLDVGDTVQLKATVKSEEVKATYASDNTSVATVDSNGKVTAKNAGNATITATYEGREATCKVTVQEEDNTIDTSSSKYSGKKYTGLTEQQKKQLAYVAYKEQGSVNAAKVELSLMANRTEYCGYSSVYNYVMNSGWFYLPTAGKVPENPTVGDEYVKAVEEVLVNGNRYLPSNVVERDFFADINSISTGDESDRSNYIPNETIIKNKYGSEYVFFGFVSKNGDAFGYYK